MTVEALLELFKSDATKATSIARGWSRDGEWDRVEELLRAPAADRHLAELLRRDLAWNEEGARQLARFLARGYAPEELHSAAAWMAAAHPVELLESIVTEHAESDPALPLLALLISETALLGKVIRGARGAPVVQARLDETRNPYRWLPWVVTPLEAQSAGHLPRYDATGGSSMGIPFGPRRGPQDREPEGPAPRLVELVPTPRTADRMALAQDFIESAAPDGLFDAPLPAISRAALLPILVRDFPECASVRAEQIYVETVAPETAFGMLLSAGLGSIPYQRSRGAAESRRRAWMAFAELAGVPQDDGPDVATIEAAVRRCKWAYFDSPVWFIQEYCDLGLAALRPDGRSLSLVMGTATD